MSKNNSKMKRLVSSVLTLTMLTGLFVSFPTVSQADEIKEYHLDLSSAYAPDWDSTRVDELSYSDGVLTLTANSGNKTFYTYPIEGNVCAFDDYHYLVFKLKDASDSLKFDVMIRGSESSFQEYERMTGDVVRQRYDDGEDTYIYFDMEAVRDTITAAGGWQGGYITRLMVTRIPQGTHKITDIYFSSVSPVPHLTEFTINADSNVIDTNEGTLTLTPHIAFSTGAEVTDFSKVSWAVNSINASAVVNDDHTLTLTGEMNGDVTATAYYTLNDTEYSADYTVTISGQPNRAAAKTIKLMTYGNSIHKHAPNESLGWYGNWGMAASSEDKDYVHRLIAMLGEKYGAENVSWVIGTGAGNFESDSSNAEEGQDWSSYLKGLETCAAKEKPDIITIQYGENSHPGEAGYSGTAEGYRDAFVQFVQMLKKGAPDALVLITTPFWGGDAKITGAKAAAAKLGIPIANLTQFNTDENKALEGEGVDPNWAAGVKAHPGDLGMENIAREMYTQLNKYLTGNDNVVYSIPPEGISIVANKTEITKDSGTLQLTVEAEPEGAGNEVVWSTSNDKIAEVDENGLVTATGNGTAEITAVSKYNSELTDSVTITVSGQSPLYKLSYNANTSDEVKDMPSDENVKAGEVSLKGKYPFRETYTFVGWSYTKDGSVIDTVEITGDTTLYAIWKKADVWTFDRDDYKEGFTIENGFNQYVLGGVFKAIETEYSPTNILKVYSPTLDLSSDDYSKLEIKLQNTAYKDDTVLHVTVHTTDGDFAFDYPVVSAEPTLYTVSLDYVTGTITGFDFTPTNMDCTIYIDDIRFVEADPNDDRFFIKQCYPKDGETNVSTDTDAVISFSRDIDISSAEVTLNGDNVTSLSIDESGRKLVIDFGELEDLKNYTLKVSGVKSTKGIVMEPYEVKFMTAIYERELYFEDFSSGTLSNVNPDTLTGSVSNTAGTYNSAPYSLKTSNPTQSWSKVELKNLVLDVGKVYRLSFYAMKPKNGTATGINIINTDEGFFVKQFGEPQNTMQYYEVEFTAKYKDTTKNVEGATIKPPFFRVPPVPDPNNVMYLDDIRVVELGENKRIENSEIDAKGHKDISVSEPIELEYAYNVGSVKNIVLETAQGEQLTGSTAKVENNKVTITPDKNIKYNTYYTLTADATDIYGRNFKIETSFITEEQVVYDNIEVSKNGSVITDISKVSPGDKLQLKISGLKNKSADTPITLSIIPCVYASGLSSADIIPVTLNGGEIKTETTIEINVPSTITAADRLSVLVWSEISDVLIKPEISDYYTLK